MRTTNPACGITAIILVSEHMFRGKQVRAEVREFVNTIFNALEVVFYQCIFVTAAETLHGTLYRGSGQAYLR